MKRLLPSRLRLHAMTVLCSAGLFACQVSLACQRQKPEAQQTPPAPAADRLAPTETMPGRPSAFGIEVPDGMLVSSNLGDVIHLSGRSSVAQLVDHFRKHVAVANIELTERGAVFPRAYINTDPNKRLYRIDITREGNGSHVRLSDVTPTPAVQGLSNAERWQRAGLNPDGSLKDRLQTY